MKHIVTAFVDQGIIYGQWDELDRVYLTNRVLFLIGKEEIAGLPESHGEETPLCLVKQLVQEGVLNRAIGDTSREREVLEGQLMDLLTPSPKRLNETFNQRYKESPEAATDYFFELSRINDYIKTEHIAKNIEFPVGTEYGELLITINLSKPEKDPKQIALEGKAKTINYPKCMLCIENEGYAGRINHPMRLNHRVIRFNLLGEPWGFQYSPYAYYPEHSIAFSETHRPMSINKKTFESLIDFLHVFPHYFIGSNADLPIVGGSILSHEHYQAGRCNFPIENMPLDFSFELPLYPNVAAGVVKWPMTVIRLSSSKESELIEAADTIFQQWQDYSDEKLDIIAYTEDGVPHHTVTPIARKRDDLYELDLVLRDNNVSKEHPDGIFHPHQERHHIKQENIGLIEVMGLAILPPRLKEELEEIKEHLLGNKTTVCESHKHWVESMKQRYVFTEDNVTDIVQTEVGLIFLEVLKDAGVYKRDASGKEGMARFIQHLQDKG